MLRLMFLTFLDCIVGLVVDVVASEVGTVLAIVQDNCPNPWTGPRMIVQTLEQDRTAKDNRPVVHLVYILIMRFP